MPENPELKAVRAPMGVPTLSVEGELPCVIVFSSEKHVKYIPPVVDFIRETLRKKGFKVKLLSDETRDISRYVDEFVRIADECVYGVVLLDGFRPNVLFEFGILQGLRKPVSLLISEDAYICVTTLYENNKDAGLSPTEFGKLKNPKIKLSSSNHFSDLSTHISYFNYSTYMGKDEHVSKKLEDSIEKKKFDINEEVKKVSSKSLTGIKQDYLHKYQQIIFKITQYYLGVEKYSPLDIENLHTELKNLEEISGTKMPSDARLMIASLYKKISKG